jgi:hypothetical protein
MLLCLPSSSKVFLAFPTTFHFHLFFYYTFYRVLSVFSYATWSFIEKNLLEINGNNNSFRLFLYQVVILCFEFPLHRSRIHHQAFDIRDVTCSHSCCEILVRLKFDLHFKKEIILYSYLPADKLLLGLSVCYVLPRCPQVSIKIQHHFLSTTDKTNAGWWTCSLCLI